MTLQYNCQPSPSNPPDVDAKGNLILYLQVTNEPCGSGTQTALIPGSIAAFAIYVAGYPAFLAYLFYSRRELIIEDQLLRAKGVGDDRLTNPSAYSTRRMFSRVYYLMKPDFYWWGLVILVRKFLIAFVSLMFARNASFQLAACLMVLFAAFSITVQVNPYMSPADFEDVLKSHEASALTSTVHAKLRKKLAAIESRGKKRTRHNLMTAEGKVDAKALLGILTNKLFNYNSVEQILLASAIVICLLGILFDVSGSGNNPYAANSAEALGEYVCLLILVYAAVMVGMYLIRQFCPVYHIPPFPPLFAGGLVFAVIITTILYFFIVVFTELWVLWNEAERRKAIAKGRAGSKKKLSAKGSGLNSQRKVVGQAFNTGVLSQDFNPIFLTGGGGGGADGVNLADAFKGDPQSLLDAVKASTKAPPDELWTMYRASFIAALGQIEALNAQLAEKATAVCSVCGCAADGKPPSAKSRQSFGPVSSSESPHQHAHAHGRIMGGGGDPTQVLPNPVQGLAAFRSSSSLK